MGSSEVFVRDGAGPRDDLSDGRDVLDGRLRGSSTSSLD